jgi:hypothetical protein
MPPFVGTAGPRQSHPSRDTRVSAPATAWPGPQSILAGAIRGDCALECRSMPPFCRRFSGCGGSALGAARIVAVAVAIPNGSVGSVDDELTLVAPGCRPSLIDRRLLGPMCRCCASAFGLYGPCVRSFSHDVDVSPFVSRGHLSLLFIGFDRCDVPCRHRGRRRYLCSLRLGARMICPSRLQPSTRSRAHLVAWAR